MTAYEKVQAARAKGRPTAVSSVRWLFRRNSFAPSSFSSRAICMGLWLETPKFLTLPVFFK